MFRGNFISALLQNLSGLHRPEQQIKFVKINADLVGKAPHSRLGFQIAASRSRWFRRINHAQFGQTPHDVLVQNRITFEANVSEKVTRLFVAKAFDTALAGQPITSLYRIMKALELLA